MRYNLTETHIAGIAAAVLAIVIIVTAVVLMSVAQPPDDGGDGTLSPTVGEVTESPTPETHTPGFTPAPTSTPKQTATPTPPPSTEPPPEDNQGIDPSKISVTPQCTDAESGEAWYELTNENAKTATISFSSTAGGTDESIAVQGGGGSAEISIPATGDNPGLVIELPGIDGGPHEGVRYPPASNACNDGTDDGTDNGTDNGTDDGSDNSTDDGTTPPPTVTFSDQTASDRQTITIKRVSLPNGGFIALSPEDSSQVWTSEYIDSGTKSDVEIDQPPNIDGEQTYTATIYNDTNGNNQFDKSDAAYTEQGNPVSDTATVKTENGNGDGNGNDGGDGNDDGDDGGFFGLVRSP